VLLLLDTDISFWVCLCITDAVPTSTFSNYVVNFLSSIIAW